MREFAPREGCRAGLEELRGWTGWPEAPLRTLTPQLELTQ